MPSRPLYACVACLTVLCLTLSAFTVGASPAPPKSSSPNKAFCTGKMEPPLKIDVSYSEEKIRAGSRVTLQGTVTPGIDISRINVRFETEGPVVIESSSLSKFDRTSAGKPLPFSVTVRYTATGKARVHVWAEALDSEETPLFAKRVTVSALLLGRRSYVGMADFQALERRVLAEDVAAKRISSTEADAQLQQMIRIDGLMESREPSFQAASADEERFNLAVGVPAGGYRERQQGRFRETAGNVTVQGNIRWRDGASPGNLHPVFGATVEIWDEDTVFDELVTVVGTDTNGNYQAVISNDDPGGRDVYVVIRAANTLVDTMSAGILGGTYVIESAVHDDVSDGAVINESFTAANTGTGPAMSLFQAGTWIAVYTRQVRGGSPLPQVDIVWPNGGAGSFYDGDVMISEGDRFDWDTIHHEFGHYVEDELNIEDNPGGPHNIGDCISVVHGSKEEGVEMAWGEGWPTYFGTSGQQVLNMAAFNIPNVGDVSYSDLEDANLVYSLEAQDGNGMGEDNEVAVQRLLWDLFDSNNDGRDTISRSDASIWPVIDASNADNLSQAWSALRAGQSNANLILMGEIASDQRIGPRLIAPAQGAITGTGSSFSWNRDVGCSPSFDGDSFNLFFFNATTSAPVLVKPLLTATSYALTAADVITLSGAGHNVLWGVEGSNTSGPGTGPYLGETFAAIVNRPPVANAGTDKSAECSSHSGTPVQLNGTGSSDLDGDSLTYTWTAAGVTFDNFHSATPTGNFSKGTTTVTLVVSDGFQSDSDTVLVKVSDTTPPVISCPANATAECTGNLGVLANDPQLAAFFAGVSATDVCDSTPSISHNAPGFFPVGVTNVKFTAVDDDGNSSNCTRTVTVVDTNAPTITVTLDTTSMWPANHKMVTFTATVAVTDICDPNPTFVLKSITSNEPDNGLGDGDTAGDIQGAAFGTADTSFSLRAERSGNLTGRIYTITYTGIDSSNNKTNSSVIVTVPHSR